MISKWKKWLSYFKEVHIESAPSEINPELYVCMQSGKLQLCSENAIYSYDENYHNFSGAFTQMNLGKIREKEVLIMGFGLGSIPLILKNTFGIDAYYTGIELDENVVYLYETYNAKNVKCHLQLICADALIFAATTQETYNLICSDIFLDNIIPAAFWERDYLENLKRSLNPGGAVLMNTLALTEINRKEADAYFENVFKKVFPKAVKLAVHLNYMLLSDKAWLE
jgi:spermidine synthase